eukprot:TRINITY_DN2780_c0_g2_i1.p1 TRINITY_DN2780_c0_g2~~TRINITY_DN2780_c0_g2_i1.p1  ORF type:complete len:426 (-),score=74.12 TRINITY_DN2780_c0_g2_i1:73-1350(-)
MEIFEECFCQLVEDDLVLEDLKKSMDAIFKRLNSHVVLRDYAFSGSVPVILGRSDFGFMKSQKDKYWVCEKSDGERALLLVLSSGLYFMSKSKRYYRVDHEMIIPCLDNIQENQHETLLDGKITYNYYYKKYCYMITDVISVNGDIYGRESFSKRLRVIRDKIIIPYRRLYENEDENPFVILGSEFHKLKNLDKIFKYVEHYPPETGSQFLNHRCLYNNNKRYNDTTGLLFVHENKPYLQGRNVSMKKWKYPFFITVDFLVRVKSVNPNEKYRNIFTLNIQGENGLDSYRKVFFSNTCIRRLMHDLEDRQSALIECVYDFKHSGEWVYSKLSTQRKPSRMTHLVKHLEHISQGLSKEILVQDFVDKHNDTTPDSVERLNARNSGESPAVYESPETWELASGMGKRPIDSVDGYNETSNEKRRKLF